MRKYPKKIRKFRGRRTTGYGKVGKHRKKGLRRGVVRQLNGSKVKSPII